MVLRQQPCVECVAIIQAGSLRARNGHPQTQLPPAFGAGNANPGGLPELHISTVWGTTTLASVKDDTSPYPGMSKVLVFCIYAQTTKIEFSYMEVVCKTEYCWYNKL